MGYDEMAVVDGEGRVHGLEGLRVVDASIMPQIITGNLNATTIMIGEKIADMIRGKEALPRSTAGYFVANGMPVRAKKWVVMWTDSGTDQIESYRSTMRTESLYKTLR